MTENERKAIVETRPVWLADGLRASFVGYADPDHCGVHSARPGFWACSWETAAAVIARPDRRFQRSDRVWRTGHSWLGLTPTRADYQTEADWEKAQESKR